MIIPTFQRPVLLRGAITSVLKQTFQNFEIIVVDDASNDNTEDVLKSISDSRIRYIKHQTNMGGSAARNTGIKKAFGEYIAFLDDDDEWLPHKLALQIDVLDNSPAEVGVVYTGYQRVNKNSGVVVSQMVPSKRGDLSKALFVKNCVGSTSSVLLKKECFQRVGLFDENLSSSQEYDLWIRISTEFQFDYIKEPLLKYNVHEKKIRNDLEAVGIGLNTMIEKYRTKIVTLKKNFGYYGLIELGIHYCLQGDTKKGRKAFVNAMQFYPLELNLIFFFVWLYWVKSHFVG